MEGHTATEAASHRNITPSASGASGASGAAVAQDPFPCIICLEDCDVAAMANVLLCAHPVCTDCLGTMWSRNIDKSSEPFPRCPMPGCDAYASDAAVASIVSQQTLRRMRHLRSIKPARTADGRRMFCIAEGCLEQLPPPPPRLGNEGGGGGEVGTDGHDDFVSTCPECRQGVCMRCGCAEHARSGCVKPLTSERQDRLYHSYVVGRVSECPRCGVHIERNGGCNTMTCRQCQWKFEFRPFKNVAEAEQSTVRMASPTEGLTARATASGDVAVVIQQAAQIMQAVPAARGAPMQQEAQRGTGWREIATCCGGFLSSSVFEFEPAFYNLGDTFFFLLWGSGFVGIPLFAAVTFAVNGHPWYLYIFLVPFFFTGLPYFVKALASLAYHCFRLLRACFRPVLRLF